MTGADRAWIRKLAWRDARAGARRLMLYVSTIVIGVAALVAIRSFAINMTAAVDAEAKVLLGADLEIYGPQPFGPEAEALFERIGGRQARQVAFGSMALFPESGASRLVRVRAVSDGFPFYGRLETEPAAAADGFRERREALVDHTLMLQFEARVGQPVRIGNETFSIGGAVTRIPGEVPTASLVGPRVFIPFDRLDATGLVQPGSRMTYSVFFQLVDSPEAVAELVGQIGPQLRALQLEAESVQFRRQSVGNALENMSRFLYLAGLAALLLGGIGVASSVHVYAKTKVQTVAILRCLGAAPFGPVAAFVLQAAVMGLIGAVTGALLGVGVQALIPGVVGNFLPVAVEFAVAPLAVLEGLATGLFVALLFAALPLMSLRRVTPLIALRMFVDSGATARRDPLSWGLIGIAVAGLATIAVLRGGGARVGLGVVAGLAVGLLVLTGSAFTLRFIARRLLPRRWPYTWRQGVANLYRPRNQTLVVMLALGFGSLVLATLYLTQASMIGAFSEIGVRSEANMVLYDIQPDQLDAVRAVLEGAGMPVLQQMAVVPMRLSKVGDRSVGDFDDEEMPPWVLRREYNSTYRDRLSDSEEIVDGEWIGRVEGSGAGEPTLIPVSLEDGIAERLKVGVGDTLEFDVQGVLFATRVASLRKVDWEQVSPNFFIVFPAGVLEPAPQQIVVLTNAPSPVESAAVQRQIVEQFANVSVMDLALVLGTIGSVIDQVVLATRFMALFSLIAGLTVLVVAVLGSRYARIRECVLLRTLGASRRQILQISAIEYLFLGALAALTGLLLAVAATWGLTRYVFETPMVLPGPALLTIFVGITLLTVLIGLWGSRGVTTRPPLEVLRSGS